MIKILKLVLVPIGFVMLFVFGCSHPMLTVHDYADKQIVVIFLDKDDSYNYIRRSEFAKGMNLLNISIRLDQDLPEDNRDNELIEYNKFIYEHLKDWCGYERNIMWGATEEAIEELNLFEPTLLPDTLYFINTSPSLEFNAFFTINKAVCVPSNMVWPILFHGMLKKYIAHEMFHIYSRYHKTERDSLYALFNFYSVDTIDTGELLKSKMIRNPDVHSNNYVFRTSDTAVVTKNLLLVVQLDENEYNDNRGITSFLGGANIFGFFDPYFYELDEIETNSFVVKNRMNPKNVELNKFKSELDASCGCLTEDRLFPEEMAADTFMFILKSREDSGMLEECSQRDKNIFEQFTRIIEKK